jgi:hypothetical protein
MNEEEFGKLCNKCMLDLTPLQRRYLIELNMSLTAKEDIWWKDKK